MICGLIKILTALQAALATEFPANYEHSRATFKAASNLAANECASLVQESFLVPSAVDQDLTVDTAFFKNHGAKLLVLQSGIHGIEGYAGAAVQFQFIEEMLTRARDLGVDVLLIHALDPYGYKYARRTDETNVNLNRNFLLDDFGAHQENSAYAKLRDILEPPHPIGSRFYQNTSIKAQLLGRLVRVGFKAAKISAGMNSGQYEFEQGLNFGGRGPTAQVSILKSLIDKHFSNYERIVFLDLHTGLGRKGVLHLISSATPIERGFAKMKSSLAKLSDQGIELTKPEDKGFFQTTGDVIEYVRAKAPRPDRVLALTAEFGTKGASLSAQLESASILISENQAHFKGCQTPEACAQIRADFEKMFNPPQPEWQRAVLNESRLLIETVMGTL